MRRLLSAAATTSLLLAQAPALAEGSADDIGVMQVKLSDVVKSNFGIQAQTQGAGTPNEVGIGGFVPLSVGDNNVFYADIEANANLADFSGYSSIVGTEVDGVTVSTSSRLGYRWLNSERSWMFGFNAGYDSRPMNTGNAKPYHPAEDKHLHHLFPPEIKYATNPRQVFFQQVAAGLEAVSSTWNFNAYALVPFGETEHRLNSHYNGGALDTYGLDVGYFITPDINALVGYYYQQGDLGDGDSSGVRARLAFNVAQGVEFGGNYSYDDAFAARASADLTIRFGLPSNETQEKQLSNQPLIKALAKSPNNRDVRVHDAKTEACMGFITTPNAHIWPGGYGLDQVIVGACPLESSQVGGPNKHNWFPASLSNSQLRDLCSAVDSSGYSKYCHQGNSSGTLIKRYKPPTSP